MSGHDAVVASDSYLQSRQRPPDAALDCYDIDSGLSSCSFGTNSC